jgi:energy-coupling factor transporter ATP-binding protein EcfA2
MPGPAEAVLLTGVYGSGKSTVVEEMASLLEERGTPYAAMDLDWLAWFDAGWDDDAAEFRMMLKNLEAVVDNYLAVDIASFILALSIETLSELDLIRAVLPMPLRVVRLTVPLDTITERLSSGVTAGRQVDLHWAGVWLQEARGAGLEDFEVPNDRPIREVALDILARLGWE